MVMVNMKMLILTVSEERGFNIMLTFKDKKFYLDGEEFKIYSGSFHYFRALPEYWEDRVLKLKAAGLNTIETYCCWNYHEPQKGVFNFEGRFDLERFIDIVDRAGMKLMVRPGPYICAEWDNGGLPSWLMKDEGTLMRCLEEPYFTHLTEYMDVILDKLKPHMSENGGPIIAIALENEYGSFGDDFEYLAAIEEIYKRKGIECLKFSADGPSYYFACTGSLPHILKGGDCGVGSWIPGETDKMNAELPDAPRYTAEYWDGDFTWWGDEKLRGVDHQQFEKDIRGMVEGGESFNLYMAHGGTNFGFTSGANVIGKVDLENGVWNLKYRPDITSYDYDAPLNEWGGYNETYYMLRNILTDGSGELPPEPTLQDIGEVKLTKSGGLFENQQIGKHFKSKALRHMEYYGQQNGYILYRKTIDYGMPYNSMYIRDVRDRAYVFLNGEFLAMRMRDDKDMAIIKFPRVLEKGDVIEILVENMGRVGFSLPVYRGDRKGIVGSVMLGEDRQVVKVAFDWEVVTFEMDNVDEVNYVEGTDAKIPAFFKGEFEASSQNDCFVHFDNFTKGVIYINGFNLGRYWDFGPQTELYLPGVLLKEKNEIVVFEAEGLKGEPVVQINSIHQKIGGKIVENIDGKVPVVERKD